MIANIGYFVLVMTFVLALYGAAAAAIGALRQRPALVESGRHGTLLCWSWLMSAFASAVGLRKWSRDRELLPWVVVVTMVTLAFFLGMVAFFENPFARLWLTNSGPQGAGRVQPEGR